MIKILLVNKNENLLYFSHNKKIITKEWFHVGTVTINDQKMGKSLGNALKVKDLLKDYSPEELRVFCLFTNPSKPINFSINKMKEIRKLLNRNMISPLIELTEEQKRLTKENNFRQAIFEKG